FCGFEVVRERFGPSPPREVPRAMARYRREPGWKFLGITHAPARFPRFHESILDDILGFLAVLQNAVSDREKVAAGRMDDHLEGVAIAVDGCLVNVVFCSVHLRRSTSVDARRAVSARKILRKTSISHKGHKGTQRSAGEEPHNRCALCVLRELCVRKRYLKIETGFPTLTSSFTRAASQFAVRMQPWLAARPIVSGLFVP